MVELRAIESFGRPRQRPAPVHWADQAAARAALVRTLVKLGDHAGPPAIVIPPADHRSAFWVQLGVSRPSPPAAQIGRTAYQLAAGAGIAFEGLHRPVDLLV